MLQDEVLTQLVVVFLPPPPLPNFLPATEPLQEAPLRACRPDKSLLLMAPLRVCREMFPKAATYLPQTCEGRILNVSHARAASALTIPTVGRAEQEEG